MKRQRILTGALVLGLLLALAVGLSLAQGPEPPEGSVERETGPAAPEAAMNDAVSIQGQLTHADGTPVGGVYNLTLSLYDVETEGTALCSDMDAVAIYDGLFNFELDSCTANDIDGRQLWLGVQVGSDLEMTPRQGIYAVPYAWSLRPGAEIKGEVDDDPILYAYNKGSGPGVWATSLESEGIHGSSWDGTGVYGSSLSGTGVHADSLSGAAIKAGGTGIIRSSADTEISVSPLHMVPDWESSSDLEFLADGVYMEVRPGASASTFEYIQIPVDLPSVLFGTPTKLKSVRICYRCDQAGSFVTATIVGQGTDSGTVNNIINNATDRTSTSWECYTVTAATPEEITGSMYIQLTLNFAGTGSAHDIRIGNVALTLTEE